MSSYHELNGQIPLGEWVGNSPKGQFLLVYQITRFQSLSLAWKYNHLVFSTACEPCEPVADTWGEGGAMPPQVFWKTIVFCSKTMEMCDVILPKQ